MNNNPIMQRVRQTTATLRRTENIKTLVETLKGRRMTASEISELLGFSPSGIRKYLRDLKELEIIEVQGHEPNTNGKAWVGSALYGLIVGCEERVENLLKLLSEQTREVQEKKEKTELNAKNALIQIDQGHHIHKMGDDSPFNLRSSRIPVHRDPLVAALFGMGNAQSKVFDVEMKEVVTL